jgi:hypothetical protein
MAKHIAIQYTDDWDIRTGGRRVAENTQKNYTKYYNGLEAFSAMIGSYITCFVLSYNAPSDFCPSMDDTAVALYMLYKTQPKDQKLMRLDSASTEVLDILSQPIFCVGDWRDPGNCIQFLSAITLIHNSINQSGQYHPVCDACVEANQQDNNSCCRRHPGQFLVWRRDNPRCSEKARSNVIPDNV